MNPVLVDREILFTEGETYDFSKVVSTRQALIRTR